MGIFDQLERFAGDLAELVTPEDVRLHVELAEGYLERGDLSRAESELSRAIDRRPDHIRALYLLGVVNARKGDAAAARSFLERASSQKTPFAPAHLMLGDLLSRSGDRDGARTAYRRALEVGLADPIWLGEAYRGLGAIHLADGRLDAALRELRKAVAANAKDAVALRTLARVQQLLGDASQARISFARAEALQPLPSESALHYAQVLASSDAPESLRRLRALTDDSQTDTAVVADAQLAIARARANARDFAAAHDAILRAIELQPARPDLWTELARLQFHACSYESALAAIDHALHAGTNAHVLADRRAILQLGLGIAYAARATEAMERYGSELDDRAALAFVALLKHNRARSALLLQGADSALADLVRAELNPAEAAASLRAVLQRDPDDARPFALVDRIFPPTNLTPTLDAQLSQLHALFVTEPQLQPVARQLSDLIEQLHKPMTLSVMGEFNAGKSTFINALLGHDIAPTGILPTTAVLHLLRYSELPYCRIVHDDHRVTHVPWDKVHAQLATQDVAHVRWVEIGYPLDALKDVQIVDTPGFNSIHEEHEALAQDFITRADAVIWLFAADQVAKRTESAILQRIVDGGTACLGVLNKIDRLTDEERVQAEAYLRKALPTSLKAIVSLSAKEALTAKLNDDAALLTRSRLPEVTAQLETHFFAHARAIQEQQTARRAATLLTEAKASLHAITLPSRDAEVALTALAHDVHARIIPDEKRQLVRDAWATFEACAKETLHFVRPRRWPLGENSASPADREFLEELLLSRFGNLLDSSRARIVDALASPLQIPRDALDLNAAYESMAAFLRGYLRGGAIENFFSRTLPKLELTNDAMRRALDRLGFFEASTLDEQLFAPLERACTTFVADVVTVRKAQRKVAELDAHVRTRRLLQPIDAFVLAWPHENG